MSKWIKVRDESELRAGMTIKMVGGLTCGAVSHIAWLKSKMSRRRKCELCGRLSFGWLLFNPTCPLDISDPVCMLMDCGDTKVFRLADDTPASESTTETTRTRERVR